MAIPVVASVSTAATGSGTSITTNAPSGVSAGDLLVMTVSTAGAASVTTPSGWTSADTIADGSSQSRAAILYRIADGTATDTPSVSLGSSVAYCAFILRVTGASATPLDVTNTAATVGSSTPTVPSITTTAANELAISMITAVASGFTTDPTNWTQKASDTSTSAKCRVYSQDAASATSYGGETITLSSVGTSTRVTVSFKENTGGSTVSRTFSENLAGTDTALRACTNFRTASENCGIKEGVFYKPKYKTFTHESLGLRDSMTVLPVWGRGVSENFGLRDSTFTRTTLYARALSEQLGMTETVNRSATLFRVVSELLALRDTLGDIQRSGPGGTSWNRTLSENLAMVDSMRRTTNYQRALIEQMALVDSVLRKVDYKRALSENLAMTEQINRAMTALRMISESLGMSDAALLQLISTTAGATSRRFYRPGALDYEWERPAWVDQESEHRGTSDEQVQ